MTTFFFMLMYFSSNYCAHPKIWISQRRNSARRHKESLKRRRFRRLAIYISHFVRPALSALICTPHCRIPSLLCTQPKRKINFEKTTYCKFYYNSAKRHSLVHVYVFALKSLLTQVTRAQKLCRIPTILALDNRWFNQRFILSPIIILRPVFKQFKPIVTVIHFGRPTRARHVSVFLIRQIDLRATESPGVANRIVPVTPNVSVLQRSNDT